MSDHIITARRHRRDFLEGRWRFYAEKARVYHDEWMEAERALARAELRRLPVMAEPVRFYGIEEVGEAREAA